MSDPAGRYSRQVLLPEIGPDGQAGLAGSRVLILGVGALGSALASILVRAGVGFLRLADRDFIELDNLQRQLLYDEQDICEGLPKAVAAAQSLRRANGSIKVEPLVVDVTASNITSLVVDCDLILDGSDNFELRALLNDACLKLGKPWVYGAAIGMTGMTMPFLPGGRPCFRCLLPVLPSPGTVPTCELAGVLGTVPLLVAAMQATEAIKLLSGRPQAICRSLRFLDAWNGTLEHLEIGEGDPRCPACAGRHYEYLEGAGACTSVKICGRSAIQVSPGFSGALPLAEMASRLSALGRVACNEYLLRFQTDRLQIMLFADGRAIIKGARDEAEARSLYARYVGL